MLRRTIAWSAAALLMLSGAAPAAPPVVRTALGQVAGIDQGASHAFLGIRYAAPPTGAARWRPPHAVVHWNGVKRAQSFGASCWQAVSPQGFGPWTHEYVVQGDIGEDCLFLNVWTPAKADARRPVLVWIHGGGFNSGSGALPIYDGAALARHGIVVVTINYRVGVFGFLAHPDLTREAGAGPRANFGLLDMVAALRWVRANIAAFGGEPDRVTIAGQSAGAVAVHDLVASPPARGLFARAIGQSGLPDPRRAQKLAQAEQAGLAFMREKGAPSLAALRAMPAEALSASKGANAVRFGPVVDGVLLTGDRAASDVPMLVGFNADEGSALGKDYGVHDQAALDALLGQSYGPSASRFAPFYPAATDAERSASNKQVRRDRALGALFGWAGRHSASQPVFAYLYDHVEPGAQAARWQAFHSSEIPYVFQTFGASPERAFGTADRAVSDRISTYWINFVRSGDPNGAGLPHWPALDAGAPEILAIGEETHRRPLLPPDKLTAMKDYLTVGESLSIF